MACHDTLGYLIACTILIFSVYVFSSYTISSPEVLYDRDITSAMTTITAMVGIMLFWIGLVYNKKLGCDERAIHVYRFLLFCASCFLVYFGFVTIDTDEIVDKTVTYHYLVKKNNNDLISILGILAGIFTGILILCSY